MANTSAARLWDHIGRPSINRQIPHARPVSAASSPAAQRTPRVCLAASPAQRYVVHTIFPCTVNLVRAPRSSSTSVGIGKRLAARLELHVRRPWAATGPGRGSGACRPTRWRQRHPVLATAARLSSPWSGHETEEPRTLSSATPLDDRLGRAHRTGSAVWGGGRRARK